MLAVSTGILGGSNAVLGIITIFISMAGWVAGSIFLKHRHSDMDMIKSLGFQMVTGGLIMFGISFLTGEWAGFDISSTPLWMVVVSWFLGYDKKPSASVFAGLIGGFIGVGVLAVSTGILGGSNAVLGIITIFISMAGWVAGSIFLKHRHSDMDMIKSLGFQMVTGGLIMFGISFLTGEWAGFDISEITLKAFLSTLHLIFFGSIIGYTCYVWLLYNTPTHIAISYAYAEPVVAVVVGALFGGEPINRITIFACVFIIISVFFVIRDKK